jgi:hypothetical protein
MYIRASNALAATFSSDGPRVVALVNNYEGDFKQTVTIWDATTDKLLQELAGPAGSAAVSPDVNFC